MQKPMRFDERNECFHFSKIEKGEIYKYRGAALDAYSITKGFPDHTAIMSGTFVSLDFVMYLGNRVDGIYTWAGFFNLTKRTTQWVQTDWLRLASFEKMS